MNSACTIVSPNYLPYARTLEASYRRHHPGELFFVLIVADIKDRSEFADEPFTTVMLEDLDLENLPSLAMKYDILELNTNVKPSFLKLLFKTYPHLENVVYLDPDIFVYARLEPIFTLLESNNIVLTPHISLPQLDVPLETEQTILSSGTYNLGFIAMRRSEETGQFLNWWEQRCLQLAYSELQTGLFVDQKWINLVPGLFEGIAICRHPGCNMAYWNLRERELQKDDYGYSVNYVFPLIFFHFSGVNIDDPRALTKYTERFTLDSRPDLWHLFESYKASVAENRRPLIDSLPYGFDRFSNGTKIRSIARRIFAAHEERFGGQDPFSDANAFYRFAKRKKLIGGSDYTGQTTWRKVNKNASRIRLLNSVFSLALFLLGPARYEMLMRYLSHFSNLRAQRLFIK